MTVLSGQTIRLLSLEAKPSLITPFSERDKFNGKSFGLSVAGYDIRCDGYCYIPPGGFVLASTLEKFHLADNLIGFVHDKSTWARMGLAVQNTVLEPGWQGFLTLELTNHSVKGIEVKDHEAVAQVVFHWTDKPVEKPYEGKYQFQEAGPQQARFEF